MAADLLFFEWAKDTKGYKVVPLRRDMFELEVDPVSTRDPPFMRPIPSSGAPEYVARIFCRGYGRHGLYDWICAGRFGSVDEGTDQHPQWLADGGSRDWIIEKGGEYTTYRLPESSLGLFMEFANLGQNLDAIEKFAGKYGLLASDGFEPVSLWFSQIDAMQVAVRQWEEGKRSGDYTAVAHTINSWLTPSRAQGSENPRFEIKLDAFTKFWRPPLRVHVTKLGIALWLQFAQTVSNDVNLRRCGWCPAWFSYGSGTGRRSKSEYCSDACRKAAWNQRKRSEAQKGV